MVVRQDQTVIGDHEARTVALLGLLLLLLHEPERIVWIGLGWCGFNLGGDEDHTRVVRVGNIDVVAFILKSGAPIIEADTDPCA